MRNNKSNDNIIITFLISCIVLFLGNKKKGKKKNSKFRIIKTGAQFIYAILQRRSLNRKKEKIKIEQPIIIDI